MLFAKTFDIFCDFRRTPISPSQLGLLWRCRGAPGCSRSAPRTALDALWAVTSAAPKPILAKEACRYATHGQNSCEQLEFSKYFSVSAEKFRFLRCFSIFFVILGSRPFLHHNGVCSGAAGSPPRRSRTRSGPPRSAPGRRSDAFWDVLLEKGPNGILTGGQMRGAHLPSCQKPLWTHSGKVVW